MALSLAVETSGTLSPPVVLQELGLRGRRIHVVRDDLLPGGTKQRAALPFLKAYRDHGVREFAYASPFCGFAQVALAACCEMLGAECIIFAEATREGDAHEFTRLAASHGARVVLAPSLPEAERIAANHVARGRGRFKVPLGFAHPDYTGHLASEVHAQWREISRALGRRPARLWLPLGSGTLARVFRQVVPLEVELACVDVHVLSEQDPRVAGVKKLKNVRYYSAPEAFCEPASQRPPVPSNLFYDSKLWALLDRNAETGDVWWNVAR